MSKTSVNIYTGNTPIFSVVVRDNGTAQDLTATGWNVTRCQLTFAGITWDSDTNPTAFDWTTNGTSGIIQFNLTGFAFPSGSFGGRITVFYAAYPLGRVVVDSLPIEVGTAATGAEPTPATLTTLLTTLSTDAAGSGSDRIAWVGQTPDKTVTEGLDGLVSADAAHAALTIAHGATGAVVGTTNSQTLTNKTLTAPVINNPTGTGAPTHTHADAANGGQIGKTGLAAGCFASQSEMENWSANDVAVTPGRAMYHPGVAKGWVRFNGTGTLSVSSSHNVTGVTDNGTGDYTITWATDFGDTNYCAVVTIDPGINVTHTPRQANITAIAAGTLQILCATAVPGAEDTEYVAVAAFGDFA